MPDKIWNIGVEGDRKLEEKEEGERERQGELEGTGWSRWRKVRDESKERDILIEDAIMRLARNLALGKFPGIHKNDPS